MTNFSRNALSLLVLCTAVAGAPPRSHELTESYTFGDYVADFDRAYDVDEFESRKGVFEENLATILEHNRRYYAVDDEDGEDRPTFTMGVNHYTDRRKDELHFGYTPGPKRLSLNAETTDVARRLESSKLPFTVEALSKLPKHVDWRDKGVVTAPKNQGACGSCWAFATTEVMESHIAIRTGKLLKLSPQHLLNCVKNPQHCGGSGGCDGATFELGFEYIQKHGLKTETEVPYTASNGQCYPKKRKGGLVLRGSHGHKTHLPSVSGTASITGYANVPTNDYLTMMNAVAKYGPIAVALDATHWSFYEGGVYQDKSWKVNHAVVVVGYGEDEKSGQKFWLVRNSWGPRWGENGYIRLHRQDDSLCGVDKKPLEGLACSLDVDGHTITPKNPKVCGTDGILFDVALPLGGHLAKE